MVRNSNLARVLEHLLYNKQRFDIERSCIAFENGFALKYVLRERFWYCMFLFRVLQGLGFIGNLGRAMYFSISRYEWWNSRFWGARVGITNSFQSNETNYCPIRQVFGSHGGQQSTYHRVSPRIDNMVFPNANNNTIGTVFQGLTVSTNSFSRTGQWTFYSA